jgi:hypothetical protein
MESTKYDPISYRKDKSWLEAYKEQHRATLASNPDFARWLDEEYVPIAGGWQY